MTRLLASGLILLCAIGCRSDAALRSIDGVIVGTIDLPEISAASVVGRSIIVAADDAADENDDIRQYHMLARIDIDRILEGGSITLGPEDHFYRELLLALEPRRAANPRSDRITDIEGLAVRDETLYVVTSHSRSKKDNYPAKRRRLVRMTLDDAAQVQAATYSKRQLDRILPELLSGSTERRPMERNREGAPDPGFNIEGLSVSADGALLFGLRSPLIDGRAVVLRAHSETLWQDGEGEMMIDARLDLGGLGIRAMERDAASEGTWIVAGISADETGEPNDWSVWFWSDDGRLDERWTRADIPSGIDLGNPEAVTRIEVEGGSPLLLLISDNGAGEPSTFALLPLDS
jgi:hypothetical protein